MLVTPGGASRQNRLLQAKRKEHLVVEACCGAAPRNYYTVNESGDFYPNRTVKATEHQSCLLSSSFWFGANQKAPIKSLAPMLSKQIKYTTPMVKRTPLGLSSENLRLSCLIHQHRAFPLLSGFTCTSFLLQKGKLRYKYLLTYRTCLTYLQII